ncbi:MAG: DNA mismatch repair protein MutS [Treponema sp.]|jgi:DNA mismatch repair protein MutS|nr:DNA mismatch repair protein MutS [Treponema sp.]
MLDQYRRIKRDHQGDVLFFRLGDFYEMFFDDALEVSALLNLTLTSRNGHPMCGIPYHAARSYIARLLKLGKKIAVCEQLSEPGRGRGVIERKVVEVITPGTTVDEDYLDKGSSNYLASLAATSSFLSFAYIDLSTGDFHATSFSFTGGVERLRQELERLQVKEMVIQESILEEEGGIAQAILDRPGMVLNRWADWLFDMARSRQRLEKQLGVSSLKGFGLEENSPELLSSGALLDYLDDTAKSLIPHVRSIIVYHDTEFVGIDESTQRNLEIIKNLRDGDVGFSLLEVLDETRTAMGRRLLKRRILHPLRNLSQIRARLDMVEIFYRDQKMLGNLREILGKIPDLERLSARLAMDKAHGKDMLSIKNALVFCKYLKERRGDIPLVYESVAAGAPDNAAQSGGNSTAGKSPEFIRLMEIRDLLERGICEDPAILLTEGNLIRDGYDPKLDELRSLRDNGRQLLEAYLEEERRATGISSLKIRYNRLIGYFFEVTKVHLAKAPPHFIRRQGIAGGERFTTDRLAALESEINGASDNIIELEKKLFLEIREKTKGCLPELAIAARRIAELDTAQSLARAATVRGWIRPAVDESCRLDIREGRHPVVEAHMGSGEFIPNDIILDGPGETEGFSFALITGPNMAGKSTYLRSAALITLMAQMGSFVPAREARIGMTDRIYCRVGASDNLARGESTFLVEMNETAHILNTATEKSLVIMDEVGRGTGTNDGLAIAWAVSEELLNRIRCRTFFATHYHELSLLSHPRLVNRSMEVLDQDGEIVFLRRLKEGPATESYGLHVARLAGLAEPVLNRAARILEQIHLRGSAVNSLPASEPFALQTAEPSALKPGAGESAAQEPASRGRQTDSRLEQLLAEIASLDPDRLTPLEALNLIIRWKRLLAVLPVSGKPPSSRKSKIVEEKNPSLFDE